MDYSQEALELHRQLRGKIEITPRADVSSRESLLLAYTPGVAAPCLAIRDDPSLSFELTRRGNMVAVVTDGTAILGLGDIGPEAGMPVMEGKCALFKHYGGVDAFPLCIRSKDVDEIVRTVQLLAGSFGGINLEDISAPRCFEIERRLKEVCDIPIFHDDQHGTAIVTGAALLNALKVVNKDIGSIKVVVNGAGAAGISIARFAMDLGVKNLILVDRHGVIFEGAEFNNPAQEEMAKLTNRGMLKGALSDALKGADVFIGVSIGNIVNREMIASMNRDAICFPLANPVPEVSREEALAGGARVIGTGRSDQPNQINNILVFPGIFRGALDVLATQINKDMMLAAAHGIANCVSEAELSADYILPLAYDKKAHETVAKAVSEAAIKTHVNRK